MSAAEPGAARGEDLGAERRWLQIVLVVALATFFLGLGDTALWDQDETKYAGLAREMVRSGDWITMRWNGEDWFVHPPLYPWLVAATGAVFGFSEFVVRVYAAAFAALAVALTGVIGRDLYGGRTGLFAAVILATTLQWFGQARLAVFDSMLFFFITLAVACWWRGYRGDAARRRWWYLLAFASAGLGTVTKGPVAGALPALALFAYLAARREVHRVRELPWLAGTALYTGIGLSWYAIEYLRHGAPFLDRMIGYYIVNRYVGTVEGQHGPIWYYVPVLLLGQFPWTAFLAPAVAWHWRRRSDAASLLVLIWCAFSFVFFSFAGTKLPNYVLGMYPFTAVAMARVFVAAADDRHRGGLRVGWWSLGAACAALFIGIAVYGRQQHPAEIEALLPVAVPAMITLVAGMAAAAWLGLRVATTRGFAAVAATMVAFYLVVLYAVLPAVERYRYTKPAALEAAARVEPDEHAVGYLIPNGIVYYSGRNWDYAWDVPSFQRILCAHPRKRLFLVVDRAYFQRDLAPLVGSSVIPVRDVGTVRLLRIPAEADRGCPARP